MAPKYVSIPLLTLSILYLGLAVVGFYSGVYFMANPASVIGGFVICLLSVVNFYVSSGFFWLFVDVVQENVAYWHVMVNLDYAQERRRHSERMADDYA
jgi:hypothetical protein